MAVSWCCVDLSGLSTLLHDTLCHGDTGLDKAANLRLLRERHRFQRAVYVGDTDRDRRASADANYDFVYAAYGFGESDAQPAFESFVALCAHLEEWVGDGEISSSRSRSTIA